MSEFEKCLKLFDIYCEHKHKIKHTQIIQLLYNLFESDYTKINIFINMCTKDSTSEIKRLCQSDLFSSLFELQILKAVCSNGNLILVKWLYQLGVDVNYYCTEIFPCALSSGNLHLMEWLYQFNINLLAINWHNYIEELDIIFDNVFKLNKIEKMFIMGIFYGDIIEIKYAIKEGVDYTILNDYAFFKSCDNNEIEIIDFLSKIDSKYYFKIRNDKIIKYGKYIYPKNAKNIIN